MSDDDRALIVAVAREDRDALAVLYDRHAAIMLGLGVKLLRDRGEAEEVLHDVFLEAWRRAGDFDPARGAVRTWLMLRMRSRCLDRIKSAGRRRTDPAGGSEELDRAADGQPPELGARVDAMRVHTVLAALPEEQRQVLELGYFAGLSSAEIAGQLGIPIGTVKSRIHAGIKKMRGSLGAGDTKW